MPTRLFKTAFKRQSAEQLAVWLDLPTSIISDAMDKRNTLSSQIRPLTTAHDFVGQALTVRVIAAGNAPVVQAIDVTEPGDVIVIAASGHMDNAVSGDNTSREFQKNGALAVVVDGAIRDLAEIEAMGMPTFARAVTPTGPHKDETGEINGEITCGGVTVRPGDIVRGDLDGVVVIPLGEKETVLSRARDTLKKEADWVARLEAGESFPRLLGYPELTPE